MKASSGDGIAGKPRRAAMAFIFVTALLDIMAGGIVVPVLPPLIEEFAGSSADAGWVNGLLISLWAMMQFVCSPIIGSLSDRYGRRPVIMVSTAGLALDYVLMALAPNLWWLAAGRILAGITSANITTIYAYLADVTSPAERPRAFGLVGAAFGGGFVLGPLIGGVLGELGPRVPFWFAAALSGVAFLYGLFILPESLAPERRMAFSWKRANPIGAIMLFRRSFPLTGLAVVNFLLYFAHNILSAIWVLYTSFRYDWEPWQIGVVLAIVGAADMIVQGLLVAPAVKRFGHRAMMVFGLAGGACGLALMGFAWTGWMQLAAIAPHALWGFAAPTLLSLMTRMVSESEQGQIQGADMSVAAVAGVVSPVFFGTIYAYSVGPGVPVAWSGLAFYIAAVILLAAALVGWVVSVKVQRGGRVAGTSS